MRFFHFNGRRNNISISFIFFKKGLEVRKMLVYLQPLNKEEVMIEEKS